MNQAQSIAQQLAASCGPELLPIALVMWSPQKQTFSVSYHEVFKEILQGQGHVIGQSIAAAVGPAKIPPRIRGRRRPT